MTTASIAVSSLVVCLTSLGCQPPATPEQVQQARQELGRYLFYDVRLSVNKKRSCGLCHEQAKGFGDAFPRAVGATGTLLARNTPTLTNVARREALLWAHPTPLSLEEQLLVPLLAQDPVEMGAQVDGLIKFLSEDAEYPARFKRAFPDERGSISIKSISVALATFERALISEDSPYDRYKRGDKSAMTALAIEGERLFFHARLGCYRCHSGPDLDQPADLSGHITARHGFFNLGLYNLDGQGAYPAHDQGLIATSKRPEDMGRFRTPTLRNIAVTAPYMHDGTVATLEDVIRLYARGGRDNTSGPYQGDGRKNPHRDELIQGFFISAQEIKAVVAFLESLTDERFLTNPALSDPFAKKEAPSSLGASQEAPARQRR